MLGIQNPELLFLLVLAAPGVYFAWKREERSKKLIAASKAIIISLLVVAAATPFIQTQDELTKTPEITVLQDNSRSNSITQDPDLNFGDIEVNRKIIASGNNSDLKQGILRNLDQNKAYLLVSDGQSSSSLEGLEEKFRSKNSTLNLLKTDTEEESAVTIEGPSSTVPGAENTFQVKVHSTDRIPKPEVILDGSKVELQRTDNNTWRFTRSFDSEGEHQIKASIDSNDQFDQNNRFYKTVDVRQKPKILVVGSKGKLGEELEKFYEVDYRSSVPSDLSDYYSVVAKKEFSGMESYLAEGNGLVYTGKVKEKEVLPVHPIDSEDQSKGAKIMIAIDISHSTGQSGSVKKSIKIAYSLVEKLGYNNKVGAVAYNRDAYIISEPKPLANNRERLKNDISQLESSGPSFHNNGLKGAQESLNGTGNIILISDGKIGGLGQNKDVPRKSKNIASDLNVRLITVGVGDDTNEDFLKELADRGNGFYLDAGQSGKLNFMFKAGGSSGSNKGLVIVNKNHFITQGLNSNSRVAGFSAVEPKPGADLLVTSTDGKPFLTTWRYGLGRVASFTGGTSDLSKVLDRDPLLVTRTVSWTVGQPQRKQDKWMKIEDGRKPGKVKVRASYELGDLRRQGEDLYIGELEPEKTGFHQFKQSIYGYSYNPELEEIGYNPEMEELAVDTGGKVYSPEDKEEIKSDVKHFSNREVKTQKPLSDYFILAALIVFLGEVGYRKLNGKK